jgi:hypothetical protein
MERGMGPSHAGFRDQRRGPWSTSSVIDALSPTQEQAELHSLPLFSPLLCITTATVADLTTQHPSSQADMSSLRPRLSRGENEVEETQKKAKRPFGLRLPRALRPGTDDTDDQPRLMKTKKTEKTSNNNNNQKTSKSKKRSNKGGMDGPVGEGEGGPRSGPQQKPKRGLDLLLLITAAPAARRQKNAERRPGRAAVASVATPVGGGRRGQGAAAPGPGRGSARPPPGHMLEPRSPRSTGSQLTAAQVQCSVAGSTLVV